MVILRRLLPNLGINAVPIAGLAAFGWSAATALAVYWFENLVGSLTVAVRIAVHRRLTGKRGHYRAHLGVRIGAGEGGDRKEREMKTLLAEFLVGSLVFTLAHGLLLGLVLGILEVRLEPRDLWVGALGVAAFQVLGLGFDLLGIRDRPFAWIKQTAQLALGRVVLIHLALIGGFALAVWSGGAGAFFLPFAVLKLLGDLVSMAGERPPRQPVEPAPWLVAAVDRLKPGGDFAAHWAETRAEELARAQEDEAVGRPAVEARKHRGRTLKRRRA